jgi:hypothetical protein
MPKRDLGNNRPTTVSSSPNIGGAGRAWECLSVLSQVTAQIHMLKIK